MFAHSITHLQDEEQIPNSTSNENKENTNKKPMAPVRGSFTLHPTTHGYLRSFIKYPGITKNPQACSSHRVPRILTFL
jgi:hypothetical protein